MSAHNEQRGSGENERQPADDVAPDYVGFEGEIPDLCFVLTDDHGSFCGWPLPCPEHIDGRDDA